jgi:hypothetical protein
MISFFDFTTTPNVLSYYYYDVLNRLINFSRDSHKEFYLYDYLGNRVRKVTPTEKTYYLYEGNNVILEESNKTCNDGTPYGECNPSGYICINGQLYLLGDVNKDGSVNGGDISYLINYLYVYGPAPNPFEVGDVNKDGLINGADISYLINYLYAYGPAPPCNSIQNPPAPLGKEYTRSEIEQLLEQAQSKAKGNI